MTNDLVIGIVGSGGDGVITAGQLIASAASNEGLYCFLLKSFGPQIRGGESSCRVRICEKQVLSQGDRVDVLVVFNWPDYTRFKSELDLKDDCVVLYDDKDETPEDEIPIVGAENRIVYRLPFSKTAKDAVGTELGKNIVMLGVLSGLFNIPDEGMKKIMERKFAKHGEEIMTKNQTAFEEGVKLAKSIEKKDHLKLEYTKTDPKLIMTGNDAIAFGALWAGCRFFAGYPITPSTEVMQWLAIHMPRYGGTVIQVEDEIAAIGMAVGASYAGIKSMTCTSGPGISLMTEIIGLASMAEIPLVIVDVQRVGPSTGIPTKSEQSDLQQVLFGTHGDAPRVVIAPADVEDCIDTTIEAFYISEKYQIPVIIISDQFIGQRMESIKPIDLAKFKRYDRLQPSEDDLKDYQRFHLKDDKTGISSMALPGTKGGEYIAVGIEHDEYGNPTSTLELHEAMNMKRFCKFSGIREELKFIRRYGPKDAEVGIIAWGSSKGAVKEAVMNLNEEGLKVQAIIPQIIYPLPFEQFDEFMAPLKKVIVVELSFSGQFLKYLKSHFCLPDNTVLYKRSGVKPLTVEEVMNAVKEAI